MDFEVIFGGMIIGDWVGCIGEVVGYINEVYWMVEECIGVIFGFDFLNGMFVEGKVVFILVLVVVVMVIVKEWVLDK